MSILDSILKGEPHFLIVTVSPFSEHSALEQTPSRQSIGVPKSSASQTPEVLPPPHSIQVKATPMFKNLIIIDEMYKWYEILIVATTT